MASLANQTISSTYDGLIKTSSDNAVPVSGVQALEDGSGNALALSVGRSGNGVTITGTTTSTAFAGNLTGNVTGNLTGTVLTAAQPNITSVGTLTGLSVNGNGTISNATNPKLEITDTTLPNTLLLQSLNGDSVIGTSTNTSLFIKTNDTTRMTVGNSGDVSVLGNLVVDTNTLYVDAANNRVGIGTSSPAVPLHTVGESLFEGRLQITSATPEIFFSVPSGGLDSRIHNDGSGNFIFGTGTNSSTPTERMRIDSSGNVGIGTSNTGYGKLGVYDASNSLLGIANSTSYAQLQQNGADLYINTNLAGAAGGNTIFRRGAGSTESMRIDSSGNVGIGTANASAPLTVLKSVSGGTTFSTEQVSIFNNQTGAAGNEATIGFHLNNTSWGSATTFARVSAQLENGSTGATSLVFGTAADGSASTAPERMRIDSSGNVGIGTTSTLGKFDVNQSSGVCQLLGRSGNDSSSLRLLAGGSGSGADLRATGSDVQLYNELSGNLILGTADTERMRIDSSGNVQIGAGTRFGKFDILDIGSSGSNFIIGAGAVGDNYYTSGTSGNQVFRTGATERMRITSGGNVLIGTQNTTSFGSGGSGFVSAANNKKVLYQGADTTGGNTLQIYYNPNGAVGNITISGSSTSYNTSSDYRLKENVVPMEGALDRVDALKPSRFNFITDPEKTVDGFLAHEVQAIVPEAVTGEKDAVDEEGNPIYQAIDQSKIVPLLVGAIKELKAEIELLKSQLS